MKIVETTRSAVRLRHAAGFFRDAEDLLAQVLPVARAAVERGALVVLGTAPSTTRALRARLAPVTADTVVALADPCPRISASGQTVAAHRARELRTLLAGGRAAAVLVEHSAYLDGPDGAFWTELDAAANVAFADLDIELTCFYPEFPLHLEVTAGALANHPLLLVDDVLHHNPEHRALAEVLERHPVPAPEVLGPPDRTVRYRPWTLRDVRTAVADALDELDAPVARAADIVLAVNEVATNAVEHGGPEGELRVWQKPDGLVCEVHGGGSLDEPLPGLRRPHPREARGRGLWIARQICDLLHVWTDRAGTHVRLLSVL